MNYTRRTRRTVRLSHASNNSLGNNPRVEKFGGLPSSRDLCHYVRNGSVQNSGVVLERARSRDKLAMTANRRAVVPKWVPNETKQTVHSSTPAQHGRAQHSTVQHATAQQSTLERLTVPHSNLHYITVRHGTLRHIL